MKQDRTNRVKNKEAELLIRVLASLKKNYFLTSFKPCVNLTFFSPANDIFYCYWVFFCLFVSC